MDTEFEKWWVEETQKGRIVMVSATEYMYMKDIAREAYNKGFEHGQNKSAGVKDESVHDS